jgi:hypothetical protein
VSTNEALYKGPVDRIDFALVRQFVIDAEDANLFSESLTFEAKSAQEVPERDSSAHCAYRHSWKLAN